MSSSRRAALTRRSACERSRSAPRTTWLAPCAIDALESALHSVARTLGLLQDFVDVNAEGFRKAVKRYVKRTGDTTSAYLIDTVLPEFDFFCTTALEEALAGAESTLAELAKLKVTVLREAAAERALLHGSSLEERLRAALRAGSASRVSYIIRSVHVPPHVVSTFGGAMLHVACAEGGPTGGCRY